jgi:hypothetical protein
MLNRIKWEEDTVKDSDGNESANKCVMVWEVRCFLFCCPKGTKLVNIINSKIK